jgi:hypothetical protein
MSVAFSENTTRANMLVGALNVAWVESRPLLGGEVKHTAPSQQLKTAPNSSGLNGPREWPWWFATDPWPPAGCQPQLRQFRHWTQLVPSCSLHSWNMWKYVKMVLAHFALADWVFPLFSFNTGLQTPDLLDTIPKGAAPSACRVPSKWMRPPLRILWVGPVGSSHHHKWDLSSHHHKWDFPINCYNKPPQKWGDDHSLKNGFSESRARFQWIIMIFLVINQ